MFSFSRGFLRPGLFRLGFIRLRQFLLDEHGRDRVGRSTLGDQGTLFTVKLNGGGLDDV